MPRGPEVSAPQLEAEFVTILINSATSPTTIAISSQPDIAGAQAPVHVPASVIGGVATPVSTANPLPVEVAAGSPAVVGDGTIGNATQAQPIFGGVTPLNGFSIANNCSSVIFVNDGGTAAANVGFPIPVGGIYTTPPGYKPAGPVSIYGGTTSGNFSARRW
jgi:hypothetical protein